MFFRCYAYVKITLANQHRFRIIPLAELYSSVDFNLLFQEELNMMNHFVSMETFFR